MFTVPLEQRALLAQPNCRTKVCIEIGTSTPLRYCTGDQGAPYDGDWYEPLRISELGKVMVSSPDASTTSFVLVNTDKAISIANASEKFSNKVITYIILLKLDTDAAWTKVGNTISWRCTTVAWTPLLFTVNISASVGDVPRAGLEIGSVRCGLIRSDSRCKLITTGHCAGTWDECTVLGNTDNHRGFRYAPEPDFVVRGIYGWMRFDAGGGNRDDGEPGGVTDPAGRRYHLYHRSASNRWISLCILHLRRLPESGGH